MKKSKVKGSELPFLLRGGKSYVLSSLLCILAGLLLGYIVLLIIDAKNANDAMLSILKNFFYFKKPRKIMYYLGSTLVKTTPLILCALAVIVAKKAGLFNIGVSGQYTAGACAALWCALEWHLPWYICIPAAGIAGALYGMIIGLLKAYRNVNEVISGIMLNWIGLYVANKILSEQKSPDYNFTNYVDDISPGSLLPNMGMDKLFGNNSFVGAGIIITVIAVIVITVIMNKTKLGYELQATGYNRDAAFYCGMKEKHNITLTMAISGCIAGLGAGVIYLTDIEQWTVTASVVPSIGFDGIAAAFLGGLNPVGAIFSSYFIKHITLGGTYVNRTIFSTQTSDLITAVIVYFCAFAQFLRYAVTEHYRKKRLRQSEAEKCEGSVK